MTKVCNKCGVALVAGENWIASSQKGRRYVCDDCRHVAAKIYRDARRAADPEAINDYARPHNARWRSENRVKAREAVYRWIKANPEKRAVYQARGRAKKKAERDKPCP